MSLLQKLRSMFFPKPNVVAPTAVAAPAPAAAITASNSKKRAVKETKKSPTKVK